MKIFVFGANGMLGRYVYSYLKINNYEVYPVVRDQVDARDPSSGNFDMDISEDTVFINCVGAIPQRNQYSDYDFITINSGFPHFLQNKVASSGGHLIHATTDCVFDGKDGNYTEISPHSATDIYGRSKSLGEPSEATIIRTSIVGEELYNKFSFIEWLKSNKEGTVFGYTDHYWNGITCLQFAKICAHDIIDKNNFWKGVKHVFTNRAVTKYDMARMVSDLYDLELIVTPKETSKYCDKTLKSVRGDVSLTRLPDLSSQLEEQKHFYSVLESVI